jgi:CobQ-like glutamine amidotransferase family enzyme
LPKNPNFADHLLRLALAHRTGADVPLTPLDDSLEERAHVDAARVARQDAASKRRGLLARLRRS